MFRALFGDPVVNKLRIVVIILPFTLVAAIPIFLLRSRIEDNARQYAKTDT